MDDIPAWVAQLHSPLDAKLGLELVEVTAERVVGRMPVDGNQQPFGLLHGGATGVLVETLASLGAAAHARDSGRVAVGVDLHVTHLAPVREGLVTGTATAVRLGRTTSHHRVEVRDERDRVTAVGALTCQLVDVT